MFPRKTTKINLKPWPNDRNIVGPNMLHALGHPLATCLDILGAVGSNLKMVKFFTQHLICRCCMMSYSFCQVRATMLRPGIFQHSTCYNMSQHVATGWLQKRATCCAQRCYDMSLKVATAWLGLSNAGPTILEFVVLKCDDHIKLHGCHYRGLMFGESLLQLNIMHFAHKLYF